MSNTRILRVSNPGFTVFKFCSVRTRSPAPASTTTVSATCATTSALPMLNQRVNERLPGKFPDASRNAGVKSTRMPRSAGPRPKRIPVIIATPKVNSRTRVSSPGFITEALAISSCPEITNERIASMIHMAKKSPSAPPASESIRLSVSNWRTILPRRAPSAKRTAISFCRAVARESKSPATFAHAISSTTPTAIINM